MEDELIVKEKKYYVKIIMSSRNKYSSYDERGKVLSYQQPHNIPLPRIEDFELNPVQIDQFRRKQHARQRRYAHERYKNARRTQF